MSVVRRPADLLQPADAWNDLLQRSQANTVFLTAEWLLSAWGLDQANQRFVGVRVNDGSGRLVAGGAFVESGGKLRFLGTGSSDYLDIPVDRDVDSGMQQQIQRDVLLVAMGRPAELCQSIDSRSGQPSIHKLHLCNLPTDQGTVASLLAAPTPLYATRLRSAPAPTLDIREADGVLKKSSLKRCENRLARNGKVTFETYREPGEVLDRLPEFFEQHIRRWSGTKWPSQFEATASKELFVQLTKRLGERGWLRFSELRLDDRLAAAHFGFHYGGRFTWYKPTYEPEMAELSPGMVLIRRLVQLAKDEGADELDFTIGDEAFKSRFATREREVVDLDVTDSFLHAAMLRTKLGCRNGLKRTLDRFGALAKVRKLLGR